MRVYLIVLILLNCHFSSAERRKISIDINEKTEITIRRTESLARLLHHVVKNYLSDCVVILIHDESAFTQHPGMLAQLFRDSTEVSFIQTHLDIIRNETLGISNDKCYHYLIFLRDIYILAKIIPKVTSNKVVIVTESTPWTVKEYLKSFASRSYINLLVITHSLSKRTEEGSYLLYTHRLYTDGSGSSLPVLLTSWIRNQTTQQSIDLFPEKLSGGFKGHRLLIATAHIPPFAIRKDIISQRTSQWDGIDIRMIQLLGKTLNFTADFRDTTTTNSPIYAATNDVLNGQVSAAVGGIYRTNNITAKLDTSFSHMEDCAAFISLSSAALPKYRAVMGPFQPGVWILICLVYFIAIIPLTMNTNYTLQSLIIKPSRFIEMFWFVFSTFTNSFVVKNPLNNTELTKNSTSILIGIYWVFTIIITSCYTGSIMAFITVPVFPAAIDTAQQLLDEGYDVGTLNHDGWEKWFNWTRYEDPVALNLLKTLEYVPTVNDGIQNASRAFFWSYAFLGSRVQLEYVVQEQFTPSWSTMRSSMHISSECFLNFAVTFVLEKDSIYTEPFNKILIRATQSGLSQKIIRDVEWDIQRTAEGLLLPVSQEYKKRKVSAEDRKLAIDDTQGMFLVLGAGILIAFLTLTIECCVYICKKRMNKTVDVSSSIITESSTSSGNHLRVPDVWYIKRLGSISDRRYTRSSI